MSNNVFRPPLTGLLKQQGKIVGRIDLPRDVSQFIEHFNHEYAPIGLRIECERAANPHAPAEH